MSQLKRKGNLLFVKRHFFFSFQHLKQSKQVLHKIRGKEGETNWRKHVRGELIIDYVKKKQIFDSSMHEFNSIDFFLSKWLIESILFRFFVKGLKLQQFSYLGVTCAIRSNALSGSISVE